VRSPIIEEDAGLLRERLRAGEAHRARRGARAPAPPPAGWRGGGGWRRGATAFERLGDRGDVLGRVAAAAAGDVDRMAVSAA
jgi:hypothetical protein